VLTVGKTTIVRTIGVGGGKSKRLIAIRPYEKRYQYQFSIIADEQGHVRCKSSPNTVAGSLPDMWRLCGEVHRNKNMAIGKPPREVSLSGLSGGLKIHRMKVRHLHFPSVGC
jgi:hypothetical protein